MFDLRHRETGHPFKVRVNKPNPSAAKKSKRGDLEICSSLRSEGIEKIKRQRAGRQLPHFRVAVEEHQARHAAVPLVLRVDHPRGGRRIRRARGAKGRVLGLDDVPMGVPTALHVRAASCLGLVRKKIDPSGKIMFGKMMASQARPG